MLALSNLTKYENGKTTKILKRWFNVFNDYLVILLLTVPIFVGGMEVVSGSYACVPVVDCSMSNNASTVSSEIKYHNVCRVFYSSQKSTDTNEKAIIILTKLKYTRDYDYVNSKCRKTAFPRFHSYFSSILFGEAFLLLLLNYLWLKNPWTASIVNNFYALAEECYNLPGAHFAKFQLAEKNKQVPETSTTQSSSSTPLLSLPTPSASQRDISEHIPPRCQGEDTFGVDLATAVAVKTLYENIRRFSDYVRTSEQIRYLYSFQAVFQALTTVAFLGINVKFKYIKGTARCSIDEHFPVIYDYFTCSHNLSTLLEQAWIVFLVFLVVHCFVCILIVVWTIHIVFWEKEYNFQDELKGWRLPSDLIPAQGDMGFLLHLLHAYNELYTVQFAIYMSKEHNRKIKTLILDNEWPMEKLEKCFYKDAEGQPKGLLLMGLSGIPKALFQLTECIAKLQVLHLNGCGPLQDYDFDQFGFFGNLQKLTLVNCGLTKIPEKLFKLEKLTFLCLKNNSIEEIQHGISSLEKLRNFDISYNNLKTIDSSIRTLPLEIINISNNPNMEVSAITNVLKCEDLTKLIVTDYLSTLTMLREEDEELGEKFKAKGR